MITLKQWSDAVNLCNNLLVADAIHIGKDYSWIWNHSQNKMAMQFKRLDIELMVLLKYQHLIERAD